MVARTQFFLLLVYAFNLVYTTGFIYPGVPVLDEPKICQEFTLLNGTPVRTRYFDNDCLVPVVHNIGRQATRDLNLVVMAPGSGALGDEITPTEPYIAMAMQEIEDSALLPGYRLNGYIADSRCSAADATANVIRAMTSGPPKHGVVGDACSSACVAINDALQFFNVLQLAHVCSSVELSDHLRHPFFTRLSPSVRESVVAARVLMVLWEWHRFAIIHDYRSIDVRGKDVLLSLSEVDNEQGNYEWTVLLVREISGAEDAGPAVAAARSLDARVIANIMYEDVGVHLFCEAHKQSMLPPHWTQVIVSGWWNAGVMDIYEGTTDCNKDDMFQAGYGWLATNPQGGFIMRSGVHGMSGVPFEDIHSRYNMECFEFFGTSEGCDDLLPPYAYDALWHYASLLHKYLIDEGHSFEELNTVSSRARLFNLSLQTDFEGLTGRVRHFNGVDPATTISRGSIGDREGPNLLRQVRGNPLDSLMVVGHRFPDDSIVWVADVIWSKEDPTKRVPCMTGTCNKSAGWVPTDGMRSACPSNTIWTVALGCAACPAGEYANGTSCLPCAAGTASNASGMVGCAACGPGHYSNRLGAETCSRCPSGRFSATEGASACEPCASGHFQASGGMSACRSCGGVFVTPLLGAEGVHECICPAGTYMPLVVGSANCSICPEGIECPQGSDMSMPEALPIVKEGYYSDESLSVFKCLDDGRRCRRGRVGESCASGRHGRVCLLCHDGKAPATDGTCKECESWADALPLALLLLLGCTCLLSMYFFFDRADLSKQSHKLLLLAMTLSMVVTMLQQIGSLALVSLAWPSPMRSIFNILSILAFDLEALKVGCMVHPRPLVSYAIRMLMFSACIALIVFVHILWVCLKHNGRFKERNPILVGGLGTICLIFYVTIFISVLGPMQCARNPNHLWTLKPFPSVICWDGHAEHTWMLVMAFTAAAVPFGFLAKCFHVILSIPKQLRSGNVQFLRSYSFLFFRYRPSAYWFSVCHLARSLLIAVTTVMPVASLQVLLMQVVQLVHLACVCIVRPWRVDEANALEAVLTLVVLLMLCCAALIIGQEREQEDEYTMAWTFVALVCSTLLGAVLMCLRVAYLAIDRTKRKSFDFFICHHKLATGCMARLMNVVLADQGKKAFIDTDDLRELDKLFQYVAEETQVLLVLCSKLVLLRPWCLGEIATAFTRHIRIVKVVRHDYTEPTREMIAEYDKIVGEDIALLTRCGIDLALIQQTLGAVSELEGLTLPRKISFGTIHCLCEKVSEKRLAAGRLTYVPPGGNPYASVVLAADVGSMEAASTAFVLASMLTAHMQDADVMKAPLVLTEEVAFPTVVEGKCCLLLLCTGDCLGDVGVLERLAEALERGVVRGMPVVGDESFIFPAADFIEKRAQELQSVSKSPSKLGNFIFALFQNIASMFQPSSYGSTMVVLVASAKDIGSRITSYRGTSTDHLAKLNLRTSEVANLARSSVRSVEEPKIRFELNC